MQNLKQIEPNKQIFHSLLCYYYHQDMHVPIYVWHDGNAINETLEINLYIRINLLQGLEHRCVLLVIEIEGKYHYTK